MPSIHVHKVKPQRRVRPSERPHRLSAVPARHRHPPRKPTLDPCDRLCTVQVRTHVKLKEVRVRECREQCGGTMAAVETDLCHIIDGDAGSGEARAERAQARWWPPLFRLSGAWRGLRRVLVFGEDGIGLAVQGGDLVPHSTSGEGEATR